MEKKVKIVVADDIDILAQGIIDMIKTNDNVEIIEKALNGEEELEKILKLKPDLVFTDMQMPKLTGIEVIERIKEMEMRDKPKFVLVTSDRGDDLIIKSRELKFNLEYKPILQEKVNYYIEECLNNEMKKKIENIEIEKEIEKPKKQGFLKRLLNL